MNQHCTKSLQYISLERARINFLKVADSSKSQWAPLGPNENTGGRDESSQKSPVCQHLYKGKVKTHAGDHKRAQRLSKEVQGSVASARVTNWDFILRKDWVNMTFMGE